MSNYGWPEESNDEVIAGLIKARNTLEAECHREHDKNVGLTDRIRELEAALREAKEVVKVFHDMGSPKHMREEMWTLYQQSPEMKRLNGLLTAPETTGERICTCDGIDQAPCPKHSSSDRGVAK